MIKQLSIFILFVALPIIGSAQYNHQFIHFDFSGETLLNKLRNDYTPETILDYDHARDTLFSKVYNENDSLSGIYTDMTLYLDPTLDPTQAAYMNGIANGINTEHCYPRSMGAADGNAKSDMHHLFPSRTITNSDRGNLPFGECIDSQTQKWYYKTSTLTSIPSQNKDLYSEWVNQTFEPRESVKGNIARAMFYFFTIYNDKALDANPDFFEQQRAILCSWHELDPIDSTEWARSVKIGTYQEDKANPYILDCSLAQRAFCPEIVDACYPNAIDPIIATDQTSMGQNIPNPFRYNTVIPVEFKQSGTAKLSIHNVLDQSSIVIFEGKVIPGKKHIEINKDINSGIYFYVLEFKGIGASKFEQISSKMIKL